MIDKRQAMDRLIAQDADLIDLPAMTDVEKIAKGLTQAQREALLPCATNRSVLPKNLTVWKTKPGHRYPDLKLNSLGYKVRDYLKGLPND